MLKHLRSISFIVFCLAWAYSDAPLMATCDPSIASGSQCGCSGWMTAIWEGEPNCDGNPQGDVNCMAGICSIQCGVSLQAYYSCQNNQYGSYIGFRCGSNCYE